MIYKLITLPAWALFLSMLLLLIISTLLSNRLMFVSVYTLVIIGGIWALSIGNKLNQKMPDEKKLNINIYKTTVFYSVIYFLCMPYMIVYMMNMPKELIPYVIVPGHLFFFSSLIWVIYFISKCIVVIRNRKESIGLYMLGLYFFPIDIWFIQPRILNILKEKNV